MTAATAADRRAHVAAARHNIVKLRDPAMTRIGWSVLVDMAIADLDAAIAIDERARRGTREHDR